METKHTKGNWNVSKYFPTDYGIYSDEGHGRDIAIVRVYDEEEAEANAKLITAAPELLEALKAVYDLAETMGISLEYKYWTEEFRDVFNPAMTMAESAIKKATE